MRLPRSCSFAYLPNCSSAWASHAGDWNRNRHMELQPLFHRQLELLEPGQGSGDLEPLRTRAQESDELPEASIPRTGRMGSETHARFYITDCQDCLLTGWVSPNIIIPYIHSGLEPQTTCYIWMLPTEGELKYPKFSIYRQGRDWNPDLLVWTGRRRRVSTAINREDRRFELGDPAQTKCQPGLRCISIKMHPEGAEPSNRRL